MTSHYQIFKFYLELKLLVSVKNSEHMPVDFTWWVNISGLVKPSSEPHLVLVRQGSFSKGTELSQKYLICDLQVVEINLGQTCLLLIAFKVLVCESAEALINTQVSLYKIRLPLFQEDFLSVSKENHGRIHLVPQSENR